ncbi:hypothetical protein LAUMK7_03593 [Mycobacterium kansasii]|uniref:Uncharacterized protein n=1 Tax=Mycobacterium kansasii TaxID=1768 RepID=A0A653F357_MYCKA|nr:hypothetical protein MKANGN_38450 [Mycobacterium kansasii]VAZ61165.1 hypothetical protein LAUMK22_02975 [Mycobacterium kansasii]VAZ67481.1 hypothetical protein LAUMK40_03621 [Mycobacterium kansasii]VAZ76911.1 hypothetical protein LAUMK7_03593 [Mycobacterium kansasii]VTP04185.1 hypothetical protein BIN_B_04288 [Mycobacterium kansasii]
MEHPDDIYIHYGLECVGIDLQNRAKRNNPGVCYQNVYPPEMLDRSIRGFLHRAEIAHISADGQHPVVTELRSTRL